MEENSQRLLEHVVDLLNKGEELSRNGAFVPFDSPEELERKAWLSQVLLFVENTLSAKHPFHKLALSYVAGGGFLGIQGMLALLLALRRELEAGMM